MNTIAVKNLKKTQGAFTLDIPHLEIPQGYITGLIGRNGAGKTTLIKLMLDILPPDMGEVLLFGKKMGDDPCGIKREIGLVGEMTGYLEQCKTDQIRSMIAPFYPQWDEPLYGALMERFSLPHDRKLNQLSKGQQKLFALLMALSRHPKLLILDEPTANLDPVVRADLLDMLKELMLDEEMTILYSTHITSDLEHAGDYIIAIENGQIQLTSEKDALLEQYCLVQGASALLTPETVPLLIGVQESSGAFRALANDRQQVQELFGREAIYEKPTIEDIMVYLARGERHV